MTRPQASISFGSGPNVARWAGVFGLASLAVFLLATPLYFIGPAQPTGTMDGGTLADFLARTHTQILTRATIADPLIIGCFVVFLAGLRHLIREADPDQEWLATLMFGAGLALSTLQLVADGLQGGAALDASSRAEPTVVRGLFEASYVFYGAIGLIVAAFMLVSAGSAILATGALPRWIGWLALAGAVVNLLAAPSIFGGTDYTAFYSASGWITYIAQLTWVAWFAIASVAMIRRPKHVDGARRWNNPALAVPRLDKSGQTAATPKVDRCSESSWFGRREAMSMPSRR